MWLSDNNYACYLRFTFWWVCSIRSIKVSINKISYALWLGIIMNADYILWGSSGLLSVRMVWWIAFPWISNGWTCFNHEFVAVGFDRCEWTRCAERQIPPFEPFKKEWKESKVKLELLNITAVYIKRECGENFLNPNSKTTLVLGSGGILPCTWGSGLYSINCIWAFV